MQKKCVIVLLLSSISALTIGCSTSQKKVDQPEQWLSLGGWYINVVADSSSTIPLQYDLLCRNPSQNAQVTSILVKESQGIDVQSINTQPNKTDNQIEFNTRFDAKVTRDVKNAELPITISTTSWHKTLPYAVVSTSLVSNQVNWANLVQAFGGGGGAYAPTRVYDFSLKNNTSAPIRFVKLIQAGDFTINNYHYINGINDISESIPDNAQPMPSSGITIQPNETMTIYCDIGFTPNTRNIIWQPAMELNKGTQQGLEILPPVTWAETNLPQKLPGSYVLIS